GGSRRRPHPLRTRHTGGAHHRHPPGAVQAQDLPTGRTGPAALHHGPGGAGCPLRGSGSPARTPGGLHCGIMDPMYLEPIPVKPFAATLCLATLGFSAAVSGAAPAPAAVAPAAPAANAPAPNWYNVEVIVFRLTDPDAGSQETWPADPGMPDWNGATPLSA